MEQESFTRGLKRPKLLKVVVVAVFSREYLLNQRTRHHKTVQAKFWPLRPGQSPQDVGCPLFARKRVWVRARQFFIDEPPGPNPLDHWNDLVASPRAMGG